MAFFMLMFASCSLPATPPPISTPAEIMDDETATLASLVKVDDYPLYTMRYVGAYAEDISAIHPVGSKRRWGCSLFAALGGEENRLYGRNFDWEFSPALLLFTDPPDGYASVSMVDIAYLGFDGADLTSHPIKERTGLLDAPFLPFDGMNEMGIAVGMAAVPDGGMLPDPQKETIGELMVIREMLDHAATVDEAVQIAGAYNIDMSEVPIHYLIADASGEAALVEFYRGEMRVFRNQDLWLHATNFLRAAYEDPAGACGRYDLVHDRLTETGGRLTVADAMGLLEDVSQAGTQWSVVYDMTAGAVHIAMGKDYETIHTLGLGE